MIQARQLHKCQCQVQRGTGIGHTIDTTCLVVAVPGSTVALPDCVLDPLLRVLVEAICDVLTRHPGLDVVALHLLDDLNTILAYAEQRASHGAVFDRPVVYVGH
jgi:hypothetical protein